MPDMNISMGLITTPPSEPYAKECGMTAYEFHLWFQAQPLQGFTVTYIGRVLERYVRCEMAFRLGCDHNVLQVGEFLSIIEVVARLRACNGWPAEMDSLITQAIKELEELKQT